MSKVAAPISNTPNVAQIPTFKSVGTYSSYGPTKTIG